MLWSWCIFLIVAFPFVSHAQKAEYASGKWVELPPNLSENTYTEIDLRKNRLEFFPIALGDMKGLEVLLLSRNPIAFPDTLRGFNDLIYLDLWDTDIDQLPIYVQGFKSLKKIDLRNTYLDEENRAELEKLFPGVEIQLTAPCICKPKR
jgi:hypothetical protein